MSKTRLVLVHVFIFCCMVSFAQTRSLLTAVNQFNKESKRLQPWNSEQNIQANTSNNTLQTGVKQLLEKYGKTASQDLLNDRSAQSDSMLIIGAVPGDSLIITGSWLCKVDILVFGDGILRFRNADATILGNIYVWGNNAEITADSSTLYIPQLYFYQRSIVAAGAAKVKLRHVTLDFSGLSHNMIVTDSATLDFQDVNKVGFTTNGVYSKAKYIIDGTNLAGEFVIGDHSELYFKNAKTVLLWHEVPKTGVFHFNFPAAGNVASYNFNSLVPGIANINYKITLQNCTDVMWALMPSDGSDVDISDSEIRAIGLWFTSPDSINVSGLVNNSSYNDFTPSLADRNLRLRNSSVQTWNLYAMQQSKLSVNGCIVGEIGCQNASEVSTTSVFVDGSGGFLWATDTAFLMAFSTPLTTTVRSERNGIVIYGYSPLSFGIAAALGNSTLLAIQSSLPEEPVAYDNASVWNVNILQPSSGNSNSVIPVKGYALIDRTPTSTHPDMDWYQLFYSTPENDSLIAITSRITTEKRNETLAEWNTSGLKPGQYLLHLRVSDASESPVIVDAVRAFTLNPGIFGTDENELKTIRIFPNPVSGTLHIEIPWEKPMATISNTSGFIVWQGSINEKETNIDLTSLAPGAYVLNIIHDQSVSVTRFIKL